MKTNIYVLAASAISVERINYYLCLKKDFLVSGSSNNFEVAADEIIANTPDILLVDDEFFEKPELEIFLKEISLKFAGIRIILFTNTLEISYLKKLLEIGVPHIVHKQSRQQLNDALKFALIDVSFSGQVS